MRSSRTISLIGTSRSTPSRITVTFGMTSTRSLSSVRFARSSWTIPMTALAIMTNPNKASGRCPKMSTITSITDMIALNLVSRFVRRMSATDRDPLDSTTLTFPSATRSRTSADVNPVGNVVMGRSVMAPLSAVVLFVVLHRSCDDGECMLPAVDLRDPDLVLLARHGLVGEEVVLESGDDRLRNIGDVPCVAVDSVIHEDRDDLVICLAVIDHPQTADHSGVEHDLRTIDGPFGDHTDVEWVTVCLRHLG